MIDILEHARNLREHFAHGERGRNIVSIFVQYKCFSIIMYLHYVYNITFYIESGQFSWKTSTI